MKPLVQSRELGAGKHHIALSKPMPNLTRFLKTTLIVAAIVGLLLVLDKIQHDIVLTPADTRPIAHVAALVLGGAALWGMGSVAATILNSQWRTAWRVSLHLIGWLGIIGSLIGVAVFILQPDNTQVPPIGGAIRAVGSFIPLVVGIQAAFLLSPDDEPGMEVLLACPRPVAWILLERWVVTLLSQSAISLIGMAASITISGERNVLIETLRWLPPALFFSGAAVYITLASRQPSFSVAVIGILWFIFNFVGSALLPGQPTMWPLNLIQPFMWAIHPYLQPGDLTIGDWWLNRILVGSLGITLIMLTVWQLRDEERVLFGGAKAKKQANEGA